MGQLDQARTRPKPENASPNPARIMIAVDAKKKTKTNYSMSFQSSEMYKCTKFGPLRTFSHNYWPLELM